jgi:hypothetical protein
MWRSETKIWEGLIRYSSYRGLHNLLITLNLEAPKNDGRPHLNLGGARPPFPDVEPLLVQGYLDYLIGGMLLREKYSQMAN